MISHYDDIHNSNQKLEGIQLNPGLAVFYDIQYENVSHEGIMRKKLYLHTVAVTDLFILYGLLVAEGTSQNNHRFVSQCP